MIDTNPFDGPQARQHSRSYGLRGGLPYRIDGPEVTDLTASAVIGAFRGFVLDPQFSCVAARSAVNRESVRFGLYDRLADPEVTAGLAYDLYRFGREADAVAEGGSFASFAAAFRGPAELDEQQFERKLWEQLQLLHDRDAELHPWAAGVSQDPGDPKFSFSFGERAFFVVGLHPNSSRLARQFPWPVLIFNPHEQFEQLRRDGRFERMRDVIRERETRLQGGINPVLTDHGADSEAKQYSGRRVGADWTAPFRPHPVPSAVAAPVSRCPFAHRAATNKG